MILIGQIDAEREQGKDVWHAAIDASSARFRPIMLTAISTVLGMIPIAPTVFWGPMAFAIMGGLLVGTILTLVFLLGAYLAFAAAGPHRTELVVAGQLALAGGTFLALVLLVGWRRRRLRVGRGRRIAVRVERLRDGRRRRRGRDRREHADQSSPAHGLLRRYHRGPVTST